MKVLCVAEKPSMAKSLAQILSNNTCRSRNGRNKYCKNFDFVYRLNNTDYQFVMTSVLGHVMETDFDAGYRKWASCDPLALFEAPVIRYIRDKLKDVHQNLIQEARRAAKLIIWTDCDREGENIGAEVAEVCRNANPRIQVLRARFSVVQPREIHRACQNPVQLNLREAAAVDARIELDLRIGAAFTRFQTLTFQPRFHELEDKIVSYGSCQFPTLGFVVDQYLKAEAFVPEIFWKIDVAIVKDDITARFTWQRGHLFDRLFCFVLYEACCESPIATVTKATSKRTSKWRPLPLTTVELQKMGTRILRLSGDRIMQIAELLYNQGFISYPRTETDEFENGFPLLPLVEKQRADLRWGVYVADITKPSR